MEGKVLFVAHSDVRVAYLGSSLPLQVLADCLVHDETHHRAYKRNLRFAYLIRLDDLIQRRAKKLTCFAKQEPGRAR